MTLGCGWVGITNVYFHNVLAKGISYNKKTNKQECFNKDKGVGKGLEIYQKSNKLRDFNTVTNNIANTKNQIICMTILLLKIFGSLLKIVPQITNWGMFLFFIYHRKLWTNWSWGASTCKR